jgi:hypothetical protein
MSLYQKNLFSDYFKGVAATGYDDQMLHVK